MLLARIGHDRYQLAAIAQRAQLVQRQKRGPGKIGFHPQHPVKFDRMPHRLVNLQPELRAIENDGEHAFRTPIGLEQRHSFLAYAARVLHQFQFAD